MKKAIHTDVLVETALLGHGLPSITNDQLKEKWPKAPNIKLVWLEKGIVKSGILDDFLENRLKGNKWKRANNTNLQELIDKKENAFLTVSSLIKLFNTEQPKSIIVSAGLGGVKDNKISQDLKIIKNSNAIVLATGFKDVLNFKQTFDFIKKSKVNVMGWETSLFDGFIFEHQFKYPLEPTNQVQLASQLKRFEHAMIFNKLPVNQRLNNLSILHEAGLAGEKAEQMGNEFHPAVNAALDRLSEGKASELQLQALVNNMCLASKLVL